MRNLLLFLCLIAARDAPTSEDGKIPDRPPGRQGATCVAVTGAGGSCVVAAGGHGGVDLLLEGKRLTLGSARNVFALSFHGDKLLEAGGRAGESGRAACWKWKTRELLWSSEVHSDLAYAVTAGGGKVFTGGGDDTISVLDLETGKRLERWSGHAGAVLAVAASPDGKHLASAGRDRSLRLWSLEGSKLLRAIHNHGDAVQALAWSPDGALLASASADRTVRVWEPLAGRLVRIVRAHEGPVLALAWTEERIISGSTDGNLCLIEPLSGAVAGTLDAHADWVAGLAAAGSVWASADWSGKVLLWEGGKAKELRD